jgi:hypothetical protein
MSRVAYTRRGSDAVPWIARSRRSGHRKFSILTWAPCPADAPSGQPEPAPTIRHTLQSGCLLIPCGFVKNLWQGRDSRHACRIPAQSALAPCGVARHSPNGILHAPARPADGHDKLQRCRATRRAWGQEACGSGCRIPRYYVSGLQLTLTRGAVHIEPLSHAWQGLEENIEFEDHTT